MLEGYLEVKEGKIELCSYQPCGRGVRPVKRWLALVVIMVTRGPWPFLAGACSPPRPVIPVTLYFADEQVQHLVPEERLVAQGEEPLEVLAVRELLKGPRDPDLSPTFPLGVKLRGVEVVDGVAHVDFSHDLLTNHPGGSTGELMTITSLLYTLTDLPGITRVLILVEGLRVETLSGHILITEPLERGPIKIHPVFYSMKRARRLQGLVDKGQERWRLDPLEVARRDGRMAGFLLSDKFQLLTNPSPGSEAVKGMVEVLASHAGKEYIIRLVQPVKSGPSGIWLIGSIRERHGE